MTLKKLLEKYKFISRHGCGADKLIEVVGKQIGDDALFEEIKVVEHNGSGCLLEVTKYRHKRIVDGTLFVSYEFEDNPSRLRDRYSFKINATWLSGESVSVICFGPILEFWHFNIEVNRRLNGVYDNLWYTVPLEDGNIRIDFLQREGSLGYISLESLLDAIENDRWNEIAKGFEPSKLSKRRAISGASA